jgi:dihydroneopterin aldolase
MSAHIMTIQLNDVKFYGYHGLYKEEQKVGNNFIVNLSIEFIPTAQKITSIIETIDYVQVYHLVNTRMKIPTPLLETIVGDIADSIFEKFSIAQKVNIQITKEKVYIHTLNGNMSVALSKTREPF